MRNTSFIDILFIIIRRIRSWIEILLKIIISFRNTNRIIVLDNGKRIIKGNQIAEGGFSIIYEATDLDDHNDDNAVTSNKTNESSYHTNHHHKYALKCIRCPEMSILECCRKEANVHRQINHPNIMPLYGMTIQSESNNSNSSRNNSYDHNTICYMLFPYIPHSLRNEMNQRIPSIVLGKLMKISETSPWDTELHLLQLFYHICCGIQTLHEHSITHRDIKLENILLMPCSSGEEQQSYGLYRPIIMDFGSSGPIYEPITTRKQILHLIDQASVHTTISYRPPELFDGGIRIMNNHEQLDYRMVDIYSLGCVLHGIMYGLAPSECEFSRSDGRIYITECSHLSVLKGIPKPPAHTKTATWYPIYDFYTLLLEPMLQDDRTKRVTLPQVMHTLESLIQQRHGIVPPTNFNHYNKVTTPPPTTNSMSPVKSNNPPPSSGTLYADHCV